MFEDGSLVVQCKAERIWTNVGEIANFKIETVIPSNGLPLVLQKNMKDYQPKLNTHLKKIASIIGKELAFEADFASINEKVVDNSYKNRLGEIIYDSYMSNVASM